MRSTHRAPSITLIVGLLLWLAPSVAQADPVATVEDGKRGYAYKFGDDPLTADGQGGYTARIRVLPQAMRRTLIRPRLHFIPEMLKSVETL